MKLRHNLKAELINGKKIIVKDINGTPVEVEFAGTLDSRTVYAYTRYGFIGGWQYPHRKMPWRYLVESINAGILYEHMNELPTGR